jgi:Transposase
LKVLLSANKRLNTAYVLKESFGQLWSYEREGWARRFFENWRGSLKWQRLKPYEREAWGGRRGTQGNGGWEADLQRNERWAGAWGGGPEENFAINP